MDLTFLVAKVWEDDKDFQTDALKEIAKTYRKMPWEWLREEGCFYVPTDRYIGDLDWDLTNSKWGLYNGDYCLYYQRLVIPLRWLSGEVFGFCGYDAGDFGDESHVKYLFPSKKFFDKSRFIYTSRKVLTKGLEEGYVFVVEGIFDTIRLANMGEPVIGLCSSRLTSIQKRYLEGFKHKIIIPDNDSAGRGLAEYFTKVVKGSLVWSVPNVKDIDDYLAIEGNTEKFKKMTEEEKELGFLFNRELS